MMGEGFYQKGRYTKVGGSYVFDKYIFRVMFIILFLSVLAVWLLQGGGDPRTQNIHLVCECDQSRLCANPLYQNYEYRGFPGISEELLETEFLRPCFEINRPPSYIKHFSEFVFIIIILGFVINHVAHNKHFSFKKFFSEIKEAMNMNEKEYIEVSAYCVKCKEKKTIKEFILQDIKTSRGVKRFAKGVCPSCGTKVMVTVSMKGKV